jgi:hypothetical protein
VRHSRLHATLCCAILLGAGAIPGAALAAGEGRWLLQTSIYTRHFHHNPEHNNHQHLVNLEYQWPNRWIAGASAFDNSFRQPSQYVYVGQLFRPLESAPLLHFKLTGGLIHGYKDQYRDKIPLNRYGIAPAIIPAIGLSGEHVSAEVNFFSTAGMMVTMGVLF